LTPVALSPAELKTEEEWRAWDEERKGRGGTGNLGDRGVLRSGGEGRGLISRPCFFNMDFLLLTEGNLLWTTTQPELSHFMLPLYIIFQI
jgi:hypothetical protein